MAEAVVLKRIEDHPGFEARDKRSTWIFRLGNDYQAQAPFEVPVFVGDWLRISADGRITVPQGYAWNGCSPKWSFLDLAVIGTPDGIPFVGTGKPKTYYASLVHDALYQYFPWHQVSRLEADRLFLDMMRDSGFSLARPYYWAVRLLGGLFLRRKHPSRGDVTFE